MAASDMEAKAHCLHLQDRVAELERALEAGAFAAARDQADCMLLRQRVAELEAAACAAALGQAESWKLRDLSLSPPHSSPSGGAAVAAVAFRDSEAMTCDEDNISASVGSGVAVWPAFRQTDTNR